MQNFLINFREYRSILEVIKFKSLFLVRSFRLNFYLEPKLHMTICTIQYVGHWSISSQNSTKRVAEYLQFLSLEWLVDSMIFQNFYKTLTPRVFITPLNNSVWKLLRFVQFQPKLKTLTRKLNKIITRIQSK